ncbi:MAG TPA: hypothetical protein PKI59_07950, partial [Candidatus Cloacimonadota bacterium]|nr:hypothetical protein [Candidatus Cloacimonadota bacterium]
MLAQLFYYLISFFPSLKKGEGSASLTPNSFGKLCYGAAIFSLCSCYDFSDQINLSALGLDMGLWGHIHYNSGSIYTYPHDLSTRSVCRGNRSYRVIRVNGSQLTPYNTIYAGSSGNNVSVSFYPSNTGVA